MSRPKFLLLLLALVAGAIAVHGAAAAMQASKPDVKREIVAVIEAQLVAFRKDNVAKAYAYAAAELRAQKPLEVFVAIVQRSYPEIWKSVRAEYGIVRDDGQRAATTVRVYSKTAHADYDFTLVREQAGWRIHGVVRHEPKKKPSA